MENILDDQNLEKQQGSKGKVSSYFFMATLCLFVVGLLPNFLSLNKIFMPRILTELGVFGSMICSFIGLGLGVVSIIKKEKSKLQLVGIIGNGIFMLFYLSILAYVFWMSRS